MIKEQEDIIDDYKWEMSRKDFLRSLLVVGVATQIPFLTSCQTETNQKTREFDCEPLSKEQLKVLQAFQLVLLPKEGVGPSALDVNADLWVVYLLNETRIPQRDKDYIIKYLDLLSGFAVETHSTSFDLLTNLQKEDLVELFFNNDKLQKNWGSRMLTLIFEALLLDPIYGVNPGETGWKWLGHNPGVPRPNNETKYPEIYTTIGDV